MEEWTYPYVHYTGQYDVNVSEDTKVGKIYADCRELWGDTIPQLLLAESDQEFDAIVADYIEKRDALGWDILIAEENRQMEENKKILGIGSD